MIADEALAEPVQLAGRHARADMGHDEVEGFGGQAPCPAHAVEILRAMDAGGLLVPATRAVDLFLVHQPFREAPAATQPPIVTRPV